MKPVTTIIPTPSDLKRTFLVVLGAIVFSLNLNTFVYTANLFPGGFTGVSLLIQRIFQKYLNITIPYTLLYLLMNAVPVYISFKFIGIKFTIYSLVMIALSSVLKDVCPTYVLTNEPILCAVFGGLLNGLSIMLCLYGDATSGGTDFIAIYFAERKGKDMWNVIFACNCIILVIAGIIFGWEAALYSIIFQFTSTQVLNVLYHRYQKTTMLIITEKPDELFEVIKSHTNHGATKFKGTGCYHNTEKTLLYTVVSQDQVHNVTSALRKVDPSAFINVLQTKEILGKFFTRPND